MNWVEQSYIIREEPGAHPHLTPTTETEVGGSPATAPLLLNKAPPRSLNSQSDQDTVHQDAPAHPLSSLWWGLLL